MGFVFKLSLILLLFAVGSCAGPRAPMTPEQEAEILYSKANQLHDAELLDAANLRFQEYMERFPNNDNADNARLKMAKNYYRQNQYSKAATACEEILHAYPNGDAADQAILLLGDCYFAQHRMDDAIETYEKLVTKYSRLNNESATAAQDRINAVGDIEEDLRILSSEKGSEEILDNAQYDIGNIYFTVFKDFEKAQREFQKVVDKYPKSELADDALWKIGECLWKKAARMLA